MDKLRENFKNTHYDSPDQSESENSPIARHINKTFDSFKSMFDSLTPETKHGRADRQARDKTLDYRLIECEVDSDSSSDYLSVLSVLHTDGRPKTAQVPSRQTMVTGGSSQPVTPEANRAPRAVSSMSYKIHKQASADDASTDTAMFTMPKIGRSARHIASRGSPKSEHVYHEYGPQKDKRRILSAPENANIGYNTIPADRSYKHTNTLIDTQKILSHIYKNSNKNGRTYVINGRTVADQPGTTDPSNTNHQHVQRKLSAPCRGNSEKPRYYMSGKRSSDLKIDTSTSEPTTTKSNKTPSPKSALTRLVEEKYIDHKQRHAWSFKSDRKKSEDTVSWARSRSRPNRNEKNPELPNISQKACASQVSKQLHLLRQRLQQAREEYNVK